MKTYDIVVIGAGHNGLITAAYLARAGLNVLVLEKNDIVGGAAVSRELHPGWIYSNCSYVCSLLRPEIMRDLELGRHGLQILPFDGGGLFTGDGRFLGSYTHPDARRREIARFSAHDAEAYTRYRRDIERQCRLIQPLLLRTPPDPASFKPRDLEELVWLARMLHGLSETEAADTIRFWTMSIAEFLAEYFEDETVKASLAISGIIGTGLGVFSPGSAYVLLHHYMGEVDGHTGAWGYARGGMGAVTAAVRRCVEALGGEVRCAAGVERIVIRNGRATGVVLENGEEVRARRVVSNADLRRTFLKLVGPEELPGPFAHRVESFKIRGSSGKVNIALDGLPHFPAMPEGSPCIRGDMHFSDSLERMERAYDDWKDGRWSGDPVIDMMIPTTVDPTMAPPGKHFMSCFVQYCPPELNTGPWTDRQRDAFGRAVIDQIARYSPDFRDLIVHTEVRTPRELEAEVGLTQGNIFHGELTFDQLFFNRPVPGFAQYRTPVSHLYLCGSSTHPGGGVMGAPGRNAAAEILRDLRRPEDMRNAYEVV